MARAPRIFTIPASRAFLPVLARALTAGDLIEGFAPGLTPELLPTATVYLPTRRACRTFERALLGAMGRKAVLLPRIVPIGDVEEEDFDPAAILSPLDTEALPTAFTGAERRLLLARLVLAFARRIDASLDDQPMLVAGHPAAALMLGDDLSRLMEQMATAGIDWSALDQLVPANFDDYWKITLDFLKIARDIWPTLLAERGMVEPATRRILATQALVERLDRLPPGGPVIVAGSTGSQRATAELIAAIARLDKGAVVLPGLDTDLDEASFFAIDPPDGPVASSHPQLSLSRLIARIGVARAEVVPLAMPEVWGREGLLSEAMRPVDTTDAWQRAATPDDIPGLGIVVAPSPREAALSAALALRQALEDPAATAALITADRDFARRVRAELGRWAIEIDDSGGLPLSDAPSGVLARLLCQVALGDATPAQVMALLEHPLLRLNVAAGGWRAAAQALEIAALRGPRPAPGLAGLRAALASARTALAGGQLHRSHALIRLRPDIAAAEGLLDALEAALAPLSELRLTGDIPVPMLAERLAQALRHTGSQPDGACPALETVDGEVMATALADLAGCDPALLAMTSGEIADALPALLGDRLVRPPGAPGARLRILGPLEARLTDADLVVLGPMVEGIIPPETRSDPWLSRPMRAALGLELPERRIGLAAHDFCQLLGARRALLVLPAKANGVPTVPSRFLQRLEAVAGPAAWARATQIGDDLVAAAQTLERTARVAPVERPAPCPPLAARPLRLGIRDIETLVRDPYSIYARYVLDLLPLDAIDAEPGAADRGIAIHEALAQFVAATQDGWPEDAAALLRELGRKAFAPVLDRPETRSLWWPRFERAADWFINWEREHRTEVARSHVEIAGQIEFAVNGLTFHLSGRADRIDERTDGRFDIIDYKTGRPPGTKEIITGFAPQLPLEAAMLAVGGFAPIPAGASVARLLHLSLNGLAEGGGAHPVPGDADTLGADTLRQLAETLARFLSEDEPFRSMVATQQRGRYGDYDHLARVREWVLGEGEA